MATINSSEYLTNSGISDYKSTFLQIMRLQNKGQNQICLNKSSFWQQVWFISVYGNAHTHEVWQSNQEGQSWDQYH